jgi:hypothetical protein
MKHSTSADNPFASFGIEESVDAFTDEEEDAENETEEETAPSSPASLYDVELTGTIPGSLFGKECVCKTQGDTFFFLCGKKSFEHSRSVAHQKSKRFIGGPVFYYRSPNLYIAFSMLFPVCVRMPQTNATVLRVAKLMAWSKTLSDDEMEPVVRQEITRLAWEWFLLFAWIPLAIALSFSALEWGNNGWVAAIGPLHGACLVFIGYIVAVFMPKTRWVTALPTGCLGCAIDYFVRFFFTLNANDGEAYNYLAFGFVMLLFAALSFLPFRYDRDIQRAFTQELSVARSAKESKNDESEDLSPRQMRQDSIE